MQAANTGSRFWYCVFDDPVSNENYTANDDQRAMGLSKYGAIMALAEPAAFILNIQTPWVEEDLADVMIKRNEQDPEHPLAVRIDPVMEIKVEAKHKTLLDLRETDVVLNFLPKLNWRFVRDKIRAPEGLNFFKTQYLCRWIKEDEGIKCQFDHDEIWRRVKGMSYFGVPLVVQNFLAVDRSGGSVARTADFNCAVVGRVQPVEGRQALILVDAHMQRAKDSELIEEILIPLIVKHKPQVIIFEEDKHWADFETNLRKELLRRGIAVPWIRHIPIDTTPNSKAKHAKRLELPIQQGRIFFNAAISQLEECLLQLEKFDGRASHSHKKDDFVDSLVLLADAMLPQTHVEPEDPKVAEARKEREEKEYDDARRRAFHDRLISGGVQPTVTTRTQYEAMQRGQPQFPPEPAPTPTSAHPRQFPRGGGFATLPGNMRGNPNKR